jgi:hypothetical protein
MNPSDDILRPPNREDSTQGSEISLLDILNFLADSWKKLALAGLVGALMGFAGWFFLGNYTAKLPLSNNEGMSILMLKSLQQTLPNLAAEIVEKDMVPRDQLAIYKAMSSPEWWNKAITPVFSLTKADIRELGSEIEKGSNTILYLLVDGVSSTKGAAVQNARNTSQFIRSGGTYLALKQMLASQQSELLTGQTEINGKINASLVELEYQQGRLKNLEVLARRFPNESRSSAQVIDPKDSGAKYLPISTQIIAINTDINIISESLTRLRDRQVQLGGLKRWLEGATPIFDSTYDGLQMNQELLALESKLRSEIKINDPKAFAFTDSLRNTLLANETRFKFGLIEASTISVKKTGMIISVVGGLAATLFLMLIMLLGQRVWCNVKNSGI